MYCESRRRNYQLWIRNYELWIKNYQLWIRKYELRNRNYELYIMSELLPVKEYLPSKHSLKSIAGRYRPVKVIDGPITARYRFMKNDSWSFSFILILTFHNRAYNKTCETSKDQPVQPPSMENVLVIPLWIAWRL